MRSGGLGAIIAIIMGFVLGFRALYRLFKMRRFLRLTLYSLFWFGYPLLAYILYLFIHQQEDVHTRMWIGIPTFFSSMIWLFFGLMINKKVENIEQNIDYKDKFSRMRRIIGLLVSLAALLAWLGGFLSYFGESESLDILGPFIISMIFCYGLMYLITGKPFEKIDD